MSSVSQDDVRLVRAALGWPARQVERASTAEVRFRDRDKSVVIAERDPVALVYGDPDHGFALPPGRFVRVDQTAGRVYAISTTPHLEALTPATARALYAGVVATLGARGWTRNPRTGVPVDSATAWAARAAGKPLGGLGVQDLGVWHLPRPRAAWAALPPGAPVLPDEWDGPRALVTLRPLLNGAAAPTGDVRFILQVAFDDGPLGSALFDQVEARQLRGGDETLAGWERAPTEDITPVLQRRAAALAARREREAARAP